MERLIDELRDLWKSPDFVAIAVLCAVLGLGGAKARLGIAPQAHWGPARVHTVWLEDPAREAVESVLDDLRAIAPLARPDPSCGY